MLDVALDYFANLFTTLEVVDDMHILGLVQKQVIDDMNEKLLSTFQYEEIEMVVKSMSALRAPIIEDFPSLFYQKLWPIIR